MRSLSSGAIPLVVVLNLKLVGMLSVPGVPSTFALISAPSPAKSTPSEPLNLIFPNSSLFCRIVCPASLAFLECARIIVAQYASF